MHLRLNYQSVHIQHPMGLLERRHKQSEKNMTLCNAKIQVLTDCNQVYITSNSSFWDHKSDLGVMMLA